MRITFEVAGLPITLEAEPKEIIEVLKAIGCEMPKAPAVKVSTPKASADKERGEVLERLMMCETGQEAWDSSSNLHDARRDFFAMFEALKAADWIRSVWEAEK